MVRLCRIKSTFRHCSLLSPLHRPPASRAHVATSSRSAGGTRGSALGAEASTHLLRFRRKGRHYPGDAPYQAYPFLSHLTQYFVSRTFSTRLEIGHENFRALIRKDALCDCATMIQTRVLRNVIQRSACAGARIAAAVDDPSDS